MRKPLNRLQAAAPLALGEDLYQPPAVAAGGIVGDKR